MSVWVCVCVSVCEYECVHMSDYQGFFIIELVDFISRDDPNTMKMIHFQDFQLSPP